MQHKKKLLKYRSFNQYAHTGTHTGPFSSQFANLQAECMWYSEKQLSHTVPVHTRNITSTHFTFIHIRHSQSKFKLSFMSAKQILERSFHSKIGHNY